METIDFVVDYLYVASGSITVFILTLIFGKKGKVWSDYILSGILIILLVNFVTFFLLDVSKSPFPVWKVTIFELSEASIFIYGPFLWLYTRSFTEADFRWKRKDNLHIIAFLLAFGYFFFALLIRIPVPQEVRNSLLVLKLFSILAYTSWSLNLLERHQRQIQSFFSNLERKKLNWLRFLCWSILSICLIAIISLVIDRFTHLTIPQYGGIVTNIALAIFVYGLGYFGFKQEFIFQPSSDKAKESTKYSKSGLDSASVENAYSNLVAFVEKEKPYLDPQLTLFSLAGQLQLPPNHLSQIINSLSGSNFYDFINKYRVEEAKRIVNSRAVEELTLLGIGLSCGFSSKSTFNRAFKKHTGYTPSEYKDIKLNENMN